MYMDEAEIFPPRAEIDIVTFQMQKQSDLGLHCLSRPFWQATSVQNYRTFTENIYAGL